MQLFPRDGHGFACFEIFDSASDFVIPSLLHTLIWAPKTVEQSVG